MLERVPYRMVGMWPDTLPATRNDDTALSRFDRTARSVVSSRISVEKSHAGEKSSAAGSIVPPPASSAARPYSKGVSYWSRLDATFLERAAV